MLSRPGYMAQLRKYFEEFPIVGILGARQVGKTTLAHEFTGDAKTVTFFDLEDSDDRARLREPKLALESLEGLVVLDEIQYQPELFQILRVLADRRKSRTKFLILGSASPSLLRQSSESLAGRIAYMEIDGFDLSEIEDAHYERVWIRGGFPPSFTARTESASNEWRRQYIRNFTERDLPNLGIQLMPDTMLRFMRMLTHYHAQVWNSSQFARSFGVSDKTIVNYLDILCSTFIAFRLLPWATNIKKRQVKAPKVYIRDSGLLNTLLGVESKSDLMANPRLGASFEGFVILQIMRRLGARPDECYFWGVHTGAELDLLVVRGRKKLGFEIKLSSAPTTTSSMHSALDELGLDRLDVIHAGKHTFPMADRLRAVSIERLLEDLEPLE
ncbi:MAG: ATP-binding protein [Planctomycetota bacterium]